MVNEREQQKMEDEKLTLKQLIGEYGWVLDHPILSELVKIAPSPKSADNYILNRFSDYKYKNKLARAVWNAVRIRDLSGGEDNIFWRKLLKIPEDSKLSDMFVFGKESDFLKQNGTSIDHVHFTTGIKFFPEGERAVDCSKWPLFLREFKIGDESSIDKGSERARFWETNRLDRFFWNDLMGSATRLDFKYEFKISSNATNDLKKIVRSNIFTNGICISGKNVKVSPQEGEIYPRFYKVLSICDQTYMECRQTIEIVLPIDGYRNSERGNVVFRKDISLTSRKSCSIVNELMATLELKFDIGKDFQLIPKGASGARTPVDYVKIRSEIGHPQLLFDDSSKVVEDTDIQKNILELYNDFRAVWSHCIKNRISLFDILDGHIIENPPEKLLNIFTEK